MKFKDIPYSRVTFEEVSPILEEFLVKIQNAQSGEEVISIYRDFEKTIDHLQTMFSVAHVRNTLDTTDEFYAAERKYINETAPRFGDVSNRISLALFNSPHRAEVEKVFGETFFKNIELELKTFKPEIIPDLQEENKLTTEFDELYASAQIEFDGKTLTLAQIAPYHQSKDRSVREASLHARAEWFLKNSEKLDRIFDDLVKVRTRIAQTLGYENFIELGYYRMTRNCYNETMVNVFRNNVQNDIVPIAKRLKEEQAQRINEKFPLTMYDDPFEFPKGNAVPTGTPDEIFAHGKKMYHDLSPETAEFIDFMLENELFDVLTRKGKSGGGYCTSFKEYKSPFIFANFNGTSGDIDVLTHEAGHAFASFRAMDIFPDQHPTYESCEVHSMSMEFFTWPHMEGFFGDQTGKYKYSHLASSLTFIPYGTMVDHFQHIVYGNPELTPAQRNEEWKKLEAMYRPWLDLDFPFFAEGRRWQGQMHIYQRPFYYIDYCLAQTAALSFWALAQKDYKDAWARYMRYVEKGGTLTFTGLLEVAGIPSPFTPGSLKETAETAVKWLNSQPKYE